jgi:2-amino-4-hydroxy-6-hydroxymethyldihydropteridine diphosphokinase
MAARGQKVEVVAPFVCSRPLGPSLREYVNGAAVVVTALEPLAFLDELQAIEALLGRKRVGQRWRSRTLDLDVVLWSGGCWSDRRLTVPHREFRRRGFVLRPAMQVAGNWRDPLTGLNLRQLHHRLARRAPSGT